MSRVPTLDAVASGRSALVGAFDVLVVCTGNLCRSPMAEGLLRDRLERQGIRGNVHSAGLVTEGQSASSHAVEAMARRGVHLDGHRSQKLRPELVRAAHLVLGMERSHLREAVVLDAGAFARTYTLREVVRLARASGPRPCDVPPEAWLARLGRDRRRSDLLGSCAEDDIEDPIGRSPAHYEATARLLEQLTDELLWHLFPGG